MTADATMRRVRDRRHVPRHLPKRRQVSHAEVLRALGLRARGESWTRILMRGTRSLDQPLQAAIEEHFGGELPDQARTRAFLGLPPVAVVAVQAAAVAADVTAADIARAKRDAAIKDYRRKGATVRSIARWMELPPETVCEVLGLDLAWAKF
jgi:hypothetical protein